MNICNLKNPNLACDYWFNRECLNSNYCNHQVNWEDLLDKSKGDNNI